MATMVLLFLLLAISFSFLSKGAFLRPKNLVNILNAMAVTALLTVGVSLLMISGKLDLSTGSIGTLCGMVLAAALRIGFPLIPALLVTIVLGAAIGLFNAMIVNEMQVAPFIATLASSSIVTGFVFLAANKQAIDITLPILRKFGTTTLFDYIPLTSLFAFVLMLIVGLILHKTKFGRHIYLVGGNPHAAMLSGINPKRMSYILFTNCGLFSALAGIVMVARNGTATITGLTNQRFQGITAAILGGIAFGGGSGGMAGAFVGLLVLNTFNNGMTVIGINIYYQNVASGLLLIFALALDHFYSKQRMKSVELVT